MKSLFVKTEFTTLALHTHLLHSRLARSGKELFKYYCNFSDADQDIAQYIRSGNLLTEFKTKQLGGLVAK